MLPEDRFFWVRGEDGQEYGPVGLQELRDWVQENRAGLGTEVRRDEQNASWQPWQNYPELIALLAEVRVTSPVPGVPGLVLASLARRAGAFALDLILASILSTPVLLMLIFAYMPDWLVQVGLASARPDLYNPPELPDPQQAIGSLVADLLLIAYLAGFIAAHGQTPAKALWRMKVVDVRGQKPGLGRAILRAVAIVFSMTLFFVPFIYVFVDPQRRAFHDYVAGTYVVEA